MSEPLPFENCVQHASLSDIGMRRQNNQDSMNAMVSSDEDYWRQRGHLFVVADGMGAHAAGELASKLAADGIVHNYAKMLDVSPPDALQRAITEANARIHQKGQTDTEFQGMGTTCSAMLLLPQGAVVGHVGDSRVYRLRGHRLEQLTFDHSLVWEMRAAGRVTDEAAEIHLPKNIITRSLGPNPEVQVDLEGPFPIAVGDTFLLCSDGLTGPVTDEELGAILSCLSPDEAARTLVDLANLRGGPDNITVIVVRVEGGPLAEATAGEEADTPSGPHPILFIVAGICLIAALAMFFLSANKVPAILCGIAAIVAAIVGVLQRFDKEEEPVEEGPPPIPVLGRGPHRAYDCTPTAKIVEELAKVAGELRVASDNTGRKIDWEQFDRLTAAADEEAKQGDFASAIRHHSQGISFVVAEIKKRQQNRKLSDSHLDLI